MCSKKQMAKKIKGHIYERSVNGGWGKVRENASKEDFEKYYSKKHKVGDLKGKPMFKLR